MKMKELSARTGISDRTIRYYIDDGLFIPENYTENYEGRRSYEFTENDVKHLKQIALLRKYGFSINEIKELEKGNSDLAKLIEKRLSEARESSEEQFNEIKTLETVAANQPRNIDELCVILSNPVIEQAPIPKADEKMSHKFMYDRTETVIRIAVLMSVIMLISSVLWLISSLLPISQISSDSCFEQAVVLKTVAIINFVSVIVLAVAVSIRIARSWKKFSFHFRKFLMLTLISMVIVDLSVVSVAFITKETDQFRTDLKNGTEIINGYDIYFPYYKEFFDSDENVYPYTYVDYEEKEILGSKYLYLENDGSEHAETLIYAVEFVDSGFASIKPLGTANVNKTGDGISYIIIHDNYYARYSTTVFLWRGNKSCRYTYGGEGTAYPNHTKTDSELLNDAINIYENYN